MGKGSLDYDEFVIDSSNKNSTGYQIRDCMHDAIGEMRKGMREDNERIKKIMERLQEDEERIEKQRVLFEAQQNCIHFLRCQLDDILYRTKWMLAIFSALFLIEALLIILQGCGVM